MRSTMKHFSLQLVVMLLFFSPLSLASNWGGYYEEDPGQEQDQHQGQGQLQGQGQGQGQHMGQGQVGINKNRNDNSATGVGTGIGIGKGGTGLGIGKGGTGYGGEGGDARQGQIGINKSDNDNRNKNENDASAYSGSVSGALSGSHSGVAGSGNSYSEGSSARSKQKQLTDVQVDGDTNTNDQHQLNAQGQVNEQDQTNEGNNSENAASSDGSGNSDIDLSDNSSNVYSYLEEEKYRAPNMSTQLNVTTSACVNFLGIQATGAGDDGAGAVGFGWPLKDSQCVLSKNASLAFNLGNYELGWQLTCAQKSIRKVYEAKLKNDGVASTGRREKAIAMCMKTGVDVEATREARIDKLEGMYDQLGRLIDMGFDDDHLQDLMARIRALETVAHMPNKGFLLQGQK